MKRTVIVCAFLLVIVTACQPAEHQPVFTPAAEATATAIPLPVNAPKVVATLSGIIWTFAISPDAATIAFATSKGMELYGMKTFAHLRTLDADENVNSISWSPNGKELALGIIKPFEDSGQAVLEIWSTSGWKIILQPHFDDDLKNERILDLAWKPDASALALTTDMHGVMVLDLTTGKVTSQQTTFASSVLQAAWSPDGSRLVSTGDMAYSLRRWKVGNSGAVRLFDQRASSSMEVSWTPDGTRIVSGHSNGVVCFWTVATNKCDGFIQAHRTAVFSLALSPDGLKLATGGGVIRIWDTHIGKLLTAFGLDDKFIYNHLVWDSSDQSLAALQTGLDDPEMTAVRLWDVSTGMPLVQFQGGKR